MGPELAARQVLGSCYLYYGLDSPLLSDVEYDALVEEVVIGWKDLSPIRKWQIGSPEEIRATGHHVKLTALIISGATAWFHHVRGYEPPRDQTMRRWHYSPEHRVRWTPL